jgi:hypothetical protein
MQATGIEAEVCADIAARQQLGIAKYGATVADNPLTLSQWLDHAYQEGLDQAVYLKRAMAELDERLEMFNFLLAQFQIADCKMDGNHGWRFCHGWPMSHARGPNIKDAIRNAMAEVKRDTQCKT